jgi:hypothetical protein
MIRSWLQGGRLGRGALLAALVSALALGMTACGKKPDSVLPPQGEENDIFPRSYPAE